MSVGDITIRVEVEGGTAKTATILSAVRVNALAWMNRNNGGPDNPNLTDATYSVHIANSAANGIIHAAKKQLTAAAEPTTPTYTAAS
jgi:hypothetical protein